MDIHKCNQESTIAKISVKVDKIEKALYDNGQRGLISTTIKLNENVNSMTDSIKILTTAVSALTKFRDETIGGIKAKERMRVHSQWIIALLSLIVLGLGTFLLI